MVYELAGGRYSAVGNGYSGIQREFSCEIDESMNLLDWLFRSLKHCLKYRPDSSLFILRVCTTFSTMNKREESQAWEGQSDGAKLIVNIARERRAVGPRDLVLCSVPFRVIDAIDVVLGFDGDAAVFSDEAVGGFSHLGGFELVSSCAMVSFFSLNHTTSHHNFHPIFLIKT